MSVVNFERAKTGFPQSAEAGQVVTYSLTGPGLALMRSYDCVDWVQIATPSPFVHAGARCTYRVDCLVYSTPAQASLLIQ